MKLSIIIPLYNESKTIVKLIQAIEQQEFIQKQIIVVNDCSLDNSYEIVKKIHFKSEHKLLHHNKNKGKGACIKTAKKFVTGDIVIIQDADLEYDPKDYKNLITPIIEKKFNVVYGSRVLGQQRYKNKNFTSIMRVFFNHFLTILSNIINNQKLSDAHTCYKVCRVSIFNSINLLENDFAFCPEFTSKVARLNEKILELPISYQGRTYEQGKKIKALDGLKAIIALINYGILNK